jgi:hypothetical protein
MVAYTPQRQTPHCVTDIKPLVIYIGLVPRVIIVTAENYLNIYLTMLPLSVRFCNRFAAYIALGCGFCRLLDNKNG